MTVFHRVFPVGFLSWCLATIPLAQAQKTAQQTGSEDSSATQADSTSTLPSDQTPSHPPFSTPSVNGVGSSSPVIQKPRHTHPHLIELSSQNWRPLSRSEKFGLFWHDMISWETHLTLAGSAALSFATDNADYLGYDTKGYFSRYGLNVADEANYTFFQAFVFPTLFHQDPRYIPMEKGSVRQRVVYAVTRVVITRNDSGQNELNKSHLLGSFVASAMCNAYYRPEGGGVGVGQTFGRTAVSLGSDAAFNLFKEFWPDFARKIHLNVWIQNIVRTTIRDEIRVD